MEDITGKNSNGSFSSILSFLKSYYFFSAILFSIFITIILNFDYRITIKKYKPGDVVEKDIEAPFEYSVIDKKETQKRINSAIERILPVYIKDNKAEKRVMEKIVLLKESLKEGEKQLKKQLKTLGIELSSREVSYLKKISPQLFETVSFGAIKSLYGEDLLFESSKLYLKNGKEITIIDESGKKRRVLIEQVLTKEMAVKKLRNFMEKKYSKLPKKFKTITLKILEKIIISNLIYDKEKNLEIEEEIRKSTKPVLLFIKKGQVIVRKGDVISESDVQKINTLKEKISERKKTATSYFLTFLYILFLTIVLVFIIKEIEKPLSRELTLKKTFNIILFNVLISVFIFKAYIIFLNLSKVTVNIGQDRLYLLIPFEISTLTVSFVVGSTVALIVAILFTFIVSPFFLKTIFSSVIVGALLFVSIYGIKTFGRRSRSSILKSILYVVLPSGIILLLVENYLFSEVSTFKGFFSKLLLLFIGSITASAFSSILVHVEETVFDIFSPIKVMEIANLDNPLLREMSIKAPGTYHHSMMVALLVENAGKVLGLDPLFLRAQAIYHDIGKIKAPEYFIENQIGKENIHDKLPPETSVAFIKKHITDGKLLAEKMDLPDFVIKGIEEHHGTSLIKYFYNKAKEQNKEEEVDERLYRYPGPKPSSKETAILMLADSVEAASKSLKTITDNKLKEMIDEIFEKIIKDGQLSEAPITLRDIDKVKKSFFETLKSSAHLRVSYPGYEFSKEEKNES